MVISMEVMHVRIGDGASRFLIGFVTCLTCEIVPRRAYSPLLNTFRYRFRWQPCMRIG
jgi:hypothetical protein